MGFVNLLTAPISNAFRVHHRKRPQTRLGTHHNYHLTWERQELPGAGAGQYSWETYGLPPYARFGFGNINVQNPGYVSGPANFVFQSVGIVGAPPAGIPQGTVVTQPLLDPKAAEDRGVVLPGAVPSPPNMILNPSPVLSG